MTEEEKGTVRKRRWPYMTAVAIVAIAGAFAAGYLIADDSSEVSDLENRVATLTGFLDEERAVSASALDDIDAAYAEVADLRTKLNNERSMNGTAATSRNVQTTDVATDLNWGEAGKVGPFLIRPTDLSQTSSSGGQATWVLSMEIKNDGDSPENPVCGDSGSTLLDSQGRSFTGGSVLDNVSASCGDDLQPGLTATYKGEFALPADATPTAAEIYGDYGYEGNAMMWTVPK